MTERKVEGKDKERKNIKINLTVLKEINPREGKRKWKFRKKMEEVQF